MRPKKKRPNRKVSRGPNSKGEMSNGVAFFLPNAPRRPPPHPILYLQAARLKIKHLVDPQWGLLR